MTVLSRCPDGLDVISGPDMMAGTPIFSISARNFTDIL
jgi:hypothetical protein